MGAPTGPAGPGRHAPFALVASALFVAVLAAGCLGGDDDRRLEVFDPEYCHPFYFYFQPENYAEEAVDVRLALFHPDGTAPRLGLTLGSLEARQPMLWGVNASELRLYVGARSLENSERNWTGTADVDAHPGKPHVWLVSIGTESGVTILRTSKEYGGRIDC